MKLKEKLITALSTIPFIAATTMSGSCAAGCSYYGLTCSFPGRCGRFTDSGGDGICDLAQTSSSSTRSNTEAASSPSSSSSSDTSSASSTASSKSSASTNNQADSSSGTSADHNSNPSDTNASVGTDQGTGIDGGSIPSDHANYYVFPMSILLIGGYLFTYYLFSKGILNQQKHRRIWNLLLTTGYMGTGFTGVLLILLINFGVKTALKTPLTFWHVELAILMVIGTLIHIHLYRKPFRNMFKVIFGFKTQKEKDEKVNPRGMAK